MSFTREELENLANLSSLKIEESEEERYVSQLNEVVDFVSNLQELDVDSYEPLFHPVEGKYMDLEEWQKSFPDKEKLLQNVKHQVKDNAIVIKSPIK